MAWSIPSLANHSSLGIMEWTLTQSWWRTPEMTAMWQDHVGRVLLKPGRQQHHCRRHKLGSGCSTGRNFQRKHSIWSGSCNDVKQVSPGMPSYSSNTLGFDGSRYQEALLTAEYGVVCANLSHDYKEAVSYNLRKNKADVIEQETVFIQYTVHVTVCSWQVDSSRPCRPSHWVCQLYQPFWFCVLVLV